jgi:hypothetical protein
VSEKNATSAPETQKEMNNKTITRMIKIVVPCGVMAPKLVSCEKKSKAG